jgi:flagellar assembly protein FliH
MMKGGTMGAEAKTRAFDTAREKIQPARIEKMAYRAAGTTSVSARAQAEEHALAARDETGGAVENAASLAEKVALLEQRLRDSERVAATRMEELSREGVENLDRAQRQAEQANKAAIEAESGRVGSALTSFAVEREKYFAQVEREIVRLALAIAARILNREAMLDPLLLAGAVRVALGQLGETTGVRLRCPVDQVERWRETLRLLPLRLVPEVFGDATLRGTDCVIETLVGSVDLGVKAQLEEIERGFFDLLEQRPASGERQRVV